MVPVSSVVPIYSYRYTVLQDVDASDCQAVEQLQADSDGCAGFFQKWFLVVVPVVSGSNGVSSGVSSGGSSSEGGFSGQWSHLFCFPVVSGCSDGVVLQAQLSAATAVRTTLPAAPSKGTAATTTPA